jgi:hypothetical protein
MVQQRPYLITDKEAKGEELHGLPVHDKVFDEIWLQEVLFRHPSVLPIELVDEDFGPLIPIGQEIASIDNLFISPKGLLTIVETKLWRNPQAHRTVVAQILDYAKGLTTWSYKDLDDAVQGFMQKSFGKPKSLFKAVKDHVRNLEVSEIEFQDLVQGGLTDGRFALLVVGDRIFPGATELAEIIQSAPRLRFSMNFVELQCYRLKKDSNWPLVVFPAFVAKTREVERAVVRITYKQEKPEVKIDTPSIEPTSRGHITLPVFIASLPPNARGIFEPYIKKWMKEGYTVYWGIAGFSLRIDWKEKKATIFDAYPEFANCLRQKKAEKLGLPEGPYHKYRSALMASPAISSRISAGRTVVYYEDMSDADIQLLLGSTDNLLHAVATPPAAGS